MSGRTRRQFVRESAAIAATLAAGGSVAGAEGAANDRPQEWFKSRWHAAHDRVWVGPEFWANPMQDWRVQSGRLECIKDAPERHVHVLTHALAKEPGNLIMEVHLGRIGGAIAGGAGSAGFRIGIRGPLDDYRNALIFGRGFDMGITGSGKLFIENPGAADAADVDLDLPEITLRLEIVTSGDAHELRLTAHDARRSTGTLGRVERKHVAGERLAGGLALVANFGKPVPARRREPAALAGLGTGRFYFRKWGAAGSKVIADRKREFGPILFSQYTLSGGTLKMTAQMPPIGPKDAQTVRLEVLRDDKWKRVADEPIDKLSRTATFRVENWDDTRDVPYRLLYALKAGSQTRRYDWTGTVRRDPVDRDVLTVADVSCNGHMAFPNADFVEKMRQLDPDLLVFTGDQFYESSGGYGVQRAPLDMAVLDLLRKWYLHGWTWRTLMRDRPSISIPDDHDVYQGNVWGEGGKPQRGTQEMGGYNMPAEWVNVVHRTQTAHHPDPYDATPAEQGISVYYGPLVYGRVSFAILADRQFKSAPEGKVPPTGSRGDHVVDPDFDPKSADLPGLELLGRRQMEFLRHWVADWRGAEMKAVVSQTIFTAMATTHGAQREVLRADYDAGGWPQTARNDALREMRKAFAFHIAGDQHLPAVIRYGIDAHGDAISALAGPAVNSVYPRWFEPREAGKNRAAGVPENTGDFIDHFGHPLTVLAVANPKLEFRPGVLEAEQDKACGLALVRFDKATRRITVECWPILADPLRPGTQFPGWPVTIDPVAESARRAAARLPKLKFSGVRNPLVQILDDAGNLIYNMRIAQDEFQPHVFAVGNYTLLVAEPETGRGKRFEAVAAHEQNDETIEVEL